MQWRRLLSTSVLAFLLLLSAHALAYQPGFEGAEHIAAGNQIRIYLSDNDPGSTDYRLDLPNGLSLTYGEILTLGDFYGASGPITEAKSAPERQARFQAAFDALASNREIISEVAQLLDVMHKEQDALDQGMKRGEKPEKIYERISDDINRQFNCVTGGGCTVLWYLFPGRYLTLAAQDVDHFGLGAWTAYQSGHALAIATAISAHATHDLKKLALAYAMNAFASHFLSDRFAGGHIRTPRGELRKQITPDVIGSLLGKFMHDEENRYGIYVHDLRGNQWQAYGDKSYFSQNSLETRVRLQEALQESANQIFTAYTQGIWPAEDKVETFIPYPDATELNQNIVPLFYWNSETHQLMRRVDTTNVYDRRMTSNWWGWTTFIMLSQQRGLPTAAQGSIAVSGYGKEALYYGLITDKNIIEYIKTH